MTDEYTNPAALEKFHKNERDRRDAGRYNLDEAATFVSEKTGERKEVTRNKLIKAAELRTLTTYAPGSHVKYEGDRISDDIFDVYWQDMNEVYWNDLNDWLEENEPKLDCKFPKPGVKAKAGKDTSPNGDDVADDDDGDWISKCPPIAQKLGEKQLETTGAQQINASSMCEAVAEELRLDPTTHGRQGPRSAHTVRTEGLKGWKFRPPKIVKKVD